MRVEFDAAPTAMACFPVGTEVKDHLGRLWIVTGVHHTRAGDSYLGLTRSAWWKRLWYRFRGLFS